MGDFDWDAFVANVGWPGAVFTAAVMTIRRVGLWLEPKLTALINVHVDFVNAMSEQLPQQTDWMKRHSDVLEKTNSIAANTYGLVREIHEVVVPQLGTVTPSGERTVAEVAAGRKARSDGHPS